MILASLTMGLISGIIALCVWKCIRIPIVSMLAAQLCLGFHVVSIIYYTCPGIFITI